MLRCNSIGLGLTTSDIDAEMELYIYIMVVRHVAAVEVGLL